MRIFPYKHRVCAVPFPWSPVKFVRLSLSCYVMRILPHKHRVCGVLFSRGPFKKIVRLCLSRFVMRTLPHKHLCHVIQYYTLLLQLVFCFAFHFS